MHGSNVFYRFYFDNPTQFQSHTQIVPGKISMTQVSGTVDRYTSAVNKSLSSSESQYFNYLQWQNNGGEEVYKNIAKEVVFKIQPYDMPLFNIKSLTSKWITFMFTYGYCIIWNQALTLDFIPSCSKYIKAPEFPFPPPILTYFHFLPSPSA